jgi:hypothetical protein
VSNLVSHSQSLIQAKGNGERYDDVDVLPWGGGGNEMGAENEVHMESFVKCTLCLVLLSD